ncbi:MAG: DUF3970 family protein [Candidatus Cloacimonetes bacterium]|nr:DUF3970 family protein [Candidatus Cloacimonadota bacterium]
MEVQKSLKYQLKKLQRMFHIEHDHREKTQSSNPRFC